MKSSATCARLACATLLILLAGPLVQAQSSRLSAALLLSPAVRPGAGLLSAAPPWSGADPTRLTDRPLTSAAVVPGQTISYVWDAAASVWQYATRVTLTYDAYAHPIQVEERDSATGAPLRRLLFTYNAQGAQTEQVVQRDPGGGWVNDTRTLTTYNSYGHATETLYQIWQGTAWVTQSGSRSLYSYDATGAITEIISQVYDAGSFVNGSHITYTSVNGQWNSFVIQYWNGNTWVNQAQFVALTWTGGRLSSSRRQDWNGTAYVDAARFTYSYGTNNSLTTLEERPSSGTGNWQNASRTVVTYDSYGNLTDYLNEQWGGTNTWAIAYATRYLLTYGSGGALLRKVEQRYDIPTGQYVNSDRFNYADFQTIATGLIASAATTAQPRLFPNPTNGPITLELPSAPASAPLTIGTVRNALGQVVQTFRVVPPAGDRPTMTLDLSQLPIGIYFVTLPTSVGTYVWRVSRE